MKTLNLSPSGDFLPILKFNAKSGRWYKRDPEGNEFVDNEVPSLTAVFDLENIRTGWLKFGQGTGPEFFADPDLATQAARPDDTFKRGFQLKVYSEKTLDGLREVMSNSISLNKAITAVFEQFSKNAQPEKVPLVTCTAVTPVTGRHGTNFEPTLEIAQWVDRPDALKNAATTPPPQPEGTASQIGTAEY
jgi:hypothetical protein